MSAPPTNNRMSLAQARDELERHGFQCFERDRSVIGRRSNLAPAYAFMTRFDTFVVAHQVDNLSLERVTADIAKRATIEKEYDFGRFPQFRSSRGRSFIVVYYADSIDPEALARITQEPKIEWCCSSFLAAQDGGGRSFFLEDTTPYRGWAKNSIYPERRYWAGMLMGRTVGERPPAHSKFIWAANWYMLALMIWHLIFGPFFLRLVVLVIFAGYAATGLIALLNRSQQNIGVPGEEGDSSYEALLNSA